MDTYHFSMKFDLAVGALRCVYCRSWAHAIVLDGRGRALKRCLQPKSSGKFSSECLFHDIISLRAQTCPDRKRLNDA